MDGDPWHGFLCMSTNASPDDLHFMQLALRQAHEAALAGEVPVGAIVVRAGQVIASGRNSPLASIDPTAHAEINALRAAAKSVDNYRLDDCTLYVTLEPCTMCSGALLNARLKRVVFGATEPKTGAVSSVVRLFDNPQLNHQTQWQGGVLAQECANVLQVFFEQRRHAHQQKKTPLRDDALRPSDDLWRTFDLPFAWSRFETQWPSLNGLRLHWFDNQTPESSGVTPQVYLHGLESWSASYLSHLAAHPSAIAIDLPGFGLSDKPKKESAHTVAWHVSVLCDFFKHAAPQVRDVFAPASLQGLIKPLQQTLPHLAFHTIAQEPQVGDPQLMQAPYPDKGHLAGPRALSAIFSDTP